MKIRNVFASIAAIAMTATIFSTTASAADWSKASYADNDPATVKIISYTENSVTFTSTADGIAAKCRITLDNVLANPDDAAKIKKLSWTVTYDGFTTDMDTASGVGGGTYAATCNSTSYWISPDSDADGNPYWANSSYTVTDEAKYLLETQIPAADGELVFMDWSNYALSSNNITVTVSDLKLFDADGNEIAQKTGEAAATTDVAATTDAAPAADATTAAATTGNTAAASAVVIMAVAAAAAVVSKKRK